MRQRSTHVVVFEKDSNRASALQRHASSTRRITTAGSTMTVLESLGRGELVVVIVEHRDPSLQELLALSRIRALSKSIEIVLFAASDDDLRLAANASKQMRLGSAVDIGDTDATMTEVEAREAHLLAEEGILQVGCTFLHSRENRIRCDEQELRVQPSTSALLEALMRAYPNPVSHATLHTGVVRFAPDAQSGAVHTRIYQVRRALRDVAADIQVEFVEGHGYRITTSTADAN